MLGLAAAEAAGLEIFHMGVTDAISNVVFFLAGKKGGFCAEGTGALIVMTIPRDGISLLLNEIEPELIPWT
jgi:hypothetical protein